MEQLGFSSANLLETVVHCGVPKICHMAYGSVRPLFSNQKGSVLPQKECLANVNGDFHPFFNVISERIMTPALSQIRYRKYIVRLYLWHHVRAFTFEKLKRLIDLNDLSFRRCFYPFRDRLSRYLCQRVAYEKATRVYAAEKSACDYK